MMNLEEMKLAVCKKLPDLFERHPKYGFLWKNTTSSTGLHGYFIHWPTEGLQICHEAEKLLGDLSMPMNANSAPAKYWDILVDVCSDATPELCHIFATYEQRLEALCRVWWPERFNA